MTKAAQPYPIRTRWAKHHKPLRFDSQQIQYQRFQAPGVEDILVDGIVQAIVGERGQVLRPACFCDPASTATRPSKEVQNVYRGLNVRKWLQGHDQQRPSRRDGHAVTTGKPGN